MHARTTVATIPANQFDEAVEFVQKSFAPAASEQPGFRGFTLLVDRSQCQVVGITLWDTEANLMASSGAGGYYQDRLAQFRAYVSGTPVSTTYEVALDTR